MNRTLDGLRDLTYEQTYVRRTVQDPHEYEPNALEFEQDGTIKLTLAATKAEQEAEWERLVKLGVVPV